MSFNKKNWPKLKQLKYLKEVLNERERFIIKILFLIIIISLLILMVRFFLLNSVVLPKIEGKYTEAMVGQPKEINPLLANNDIDLSLNNLIFSGILKKDINLELKPDLVKDFNLDLNQQTKENEYDFCLKENVFWHDNKEITTQDIAFTINLSKNPKINSSLFEDVEIELIDEQCFKIKTNNWSALTTGILPKHVWENVKPEEITKSEFNIRPIGSGPYQFSSLVENDQEIKIYNLERNKNYFSPGPFLKEISFIFFSNFTEAIQALQKKEINGLVCSPYQFSEDIEIRKTKEYQLNLPYYLAAFLNIRYSEEENNILQERSVREALAYLTPKQKIFNDVLNQQGEIINGPITPSSPYYNSEITKYEYNPQLSEEILKNAGWTKGDQGFYQKNNKILEINITTIDQPVFNKIAQAIQKSWQEIGLKVKLTVIPSNQVKEIIKENKFEVFLYGVLETPHSDPFSLWHSSQIDYPGLNLTGFSYRRVDELLEKASLTEDQSKKKEYYFEFQKITTDYIPAIFLFNTIYNYLVDEEIKGININQIIHPADRFNEVESWYLKTKREINLKPNKIKQ